MLAEEYTRVNVVRMRLVEELKTRNVTYRWQRTKIGRGVPRRITQTVEAVASPVTAGPGVLVCVGRVCYKFVAEIWLTTTCLSSIFLRAK
jgi:hypothetical protein